MSALQLSDPSPVINTLGSNAFSSAFFHYFASELDVDHCTVFAFDPAVKCPQVVVAESLDLLMRQRVQEAAKRYISTSFQLDPNVNLLLQAPDQERLYALRPEEIQNRQFRYQYYESQNIKHEAVALTCVAGQPCYISFYRGSGRAPIGDKEIDMISSRMQLATSLLQKHLEIKHLQSAPAPRSAEEILPSLKRVLLDGGYKLSDREAEICAGIILGFTVLGISLRLNITVNTVATHRKRAYAKLGISSQNELFSRYFYMVQRCSTILV